MKTLAVEHLKERDKCAGKAERYVDFVFEKCKSDSAPYNSSKANKLRSFSDIM